MHKRDLFVLALSCFAVYFSLQREGAFSFEPAWSFPHDEDVLSLGEAALPHPVVADLNGDGRREARRACTPSLPAGLRQGAPQVIVATHDARLLVLEQPRTPDARGGFAPARLQSQASLLPAHVRVASGRRAVALAVGHLEAASALNSSSSSVVTPPRKSVIVVLTAGWSLLCFDHNLRLLWETALGADFPQGWAAREVAVLVAPSPLRPGDVGLVLVAASAARQEGADPLEEEVEWEGRVMRGRRGGAGAAAGGAGGAGVDGTHHVNYYAFEGRSGAPRWRHQSADFHRDGDALAEGLTAQHSYKLDAAALEGRHFGEVECRDYREAVLAAMPHAWARTADTRLTLAHWAKHKQRAAGGAPPSSAAGAGAGSCPNLGSCPNVVVAHLREGLEAVHLESGRTVCKLLLSPGGLHADLNGDGVLDHVTAEGWRAHSGGRERVAHCSARVTSGVPARTTLFNGSVCRSVQARGVAPTATLWEGGADPPGGVSIDMAPPAALGGREGMRRRLDAVFLNSRGDVSAYSPDGRRHFQLRSDAAWQPGAVPTLLPLLLRAGSSAPALLAAGDRAALLLSPAGSVLAHLPLPGAPVAPLQVADLGGDGAAGLLLRTEGGLFAFRQHHRPGALPMAFLLGALMLVLIASWAAQSGGGGGRSTDAVEARTD